MSNEFRVIIENVNGSYLVRRDFYRSGVIIINGKEFKDFTSGWIDEKPDHIKFVEKRTIVVSYGGLSRDEYEKGLGKYPVDSDGARIFKTLEEEFEYRKFVEEHPAITKEVDHVSECEIIEYDITGKTDHEMIVPLRFLGKNPVQDGRVLYRYACEPYKIARKVASEMGFEEVEDKTWGGDNTQGKKWSCPCHSRGTLEYTKINGGYADYKKLSFYGIEVGSYDECLERYNSHYAAIKEMFSKVLQKINAVGKNFDRAMLLSDLENLKRVVASVQFKRGYYDTSKERIKNQIDEIIKKL